MTGCTFLLLAVASLSAAPQTQPSDADQQAVRKSIAAYTEAYNRGDVDAVATFYTDDAQYVSQDGSIAKGRKEIREQITRTFEAQKGGKLAIQVESIEIPRRNMAIVRGLGTVAQPGGEFTSAPFRAVHIPRGEVWAIKTVEEFGPGGDALSQLDWMVGNWLDEDENASISTTCEWAPNRRFLTRSFVASYKEGPELRGTEIIGWDPAARAIRSWIFDSDGSFGQSVWSHRGENWIVKSRGVLPDGGRASAVHIYTMQGPDRYTWESVDREVDGQIMPDIAPIAISRATATQPAQAAAETNP